MWRRLGHSCRSPPFGKLRGRSVKEEGRAHHKSDIRCGSDLRGVVGLSAVAARSLCAKRLRADGGRSDPSVHGVGPEGRQGRSRKQVTRDAEEIVDGAVNANEASGLPWDLKRCIFRSRRTEMRISARLSSRNRPGRCRDRQPKVLNTAGMEAVGHELIWGVALFPEQFQGCTSVAATLNQ